MNRIQAERAYVEEREKIKAEMLYKQVCISACIDGLVLTKVVDHLNKIFETDAFFIGLGPYPLRFLMWKALGKYYRMPNLSSENKKSDL